MALLTTLAWGSKMEDTGCICKGNWRNIVKESEPLLDKLFKDKDGVVWRFFGVVHGSDDYYYGMNRFDDNSVLLCSCVGNLTTHGFTVFEWPWPNEEGLK